MILIKTRGRSGRGEECQWEWHFAEGAWASGILFRARAAAQRSAARWFHLRSHTTATGRACSGDRATSSWAAAAATQSVTLEHHARTAATHLQQQHSNNTRSAGEERSRGEGAFHVGSCRRRWWWRRRRWWSDQLASVALNICPTGPASWEKDENGGSSSVTPNQNDPILQSQTFRKASKFYSI